MSTIIQTIQQCVYKSSADPGVTVAEDKDPELESLKSEVNEENTAGQSKCDKKTDEVTDERSKGNLLWRMSSGLYSTATGAVGYGVGSVKWVAGKTYDVGSTVVSHVKVPSASTFKRKDKKE